MSIKTRALAGLALAGALGAITTQAQARPDVQWAVTIGTPHAHVQVRDTYWPYRPTVVLPAPVFVPRPVMYRDSDRDGIPDHRDRVYNPRWDRDGDGVPNRYDPYPNGRPGHGHGHFHGGRGDRDHDGVPNWRDDRDHRDRDHDGVPNWRDRRDHRDHDRDGVPNWRDRDDHRRN